MRARSRTWRELRVMFHGEPVAGQRFIAGDAKRECPESPDPSMRHGYWARSPRSQWHFVPAGQERALCWVFRVSPESQEAREMPCEFVCKRCQVRLAP